MDGRRLYDWWSRNLWALGGMYGLVFLGRERTFRRRSIAALDLDSGDSVLELGCGPGNSFAPLRDAVGPDGLVVGVDYSHGMVQRASDRIADADWENVHAVRADATEPGLVPDIPAAVDDTFETHALRDYHGGSIYVATGSRPQANSGPAATD